MRPVTGAHPLFDRSTAAGRLMAGLDWGATPVGAPEGWPQSLRGAVRTVLSSRYPMLLLWGEQYTQLYNDAYSALIGDQHPAAMGGDVRVTLAEGWPVLGPLITEAVDTGVASWVPALQLLLERAGYREEAYFSVSHAPARDDQGVTRGVLTVCSEVTEQVVGQRRLQLLRDLSVLDVGTPSVERTCAALVAAVAEHPLDVPFAGLYLRSGSDLRRAASSVADLPEAVAATGDDDWGLARAAAGSGPAASASAARLEVPGGPWGDRVREALALPLPSADRHQPLGVLLVGVSPNRALDDEYRSFLGLLAQQVSVAVRNARTYEDERARAQALAELDRVKTSFFTNVSHEFRTPLTLMLGPLDDALADDAAPLPPVQRERVETAVRGSRRLLKLVNNLMTFSSLEAGRTVARRAEVDLARLTEDVASSFRAAVERAGLRLDVSCPPLPRAVALDPEHWQQVVGNLLSNALKFTFVGGIAVRLASDAAEVRLEVEDTGVGIPEAELPRLFDRFHRVVGSRSRSQEGTGIGLAVVRELAQLQGGSVQVGSEVGTGTRFVVRLPWTALDGPAGGPAGADPARADGGGPAGSVRAAVEEATSWTAPVARPAPAAPAG
ncbi:MAG: PAS/PAC sensor hybrid histidine kinase, partial [uncultured Quadrisphaera sp.]